MLQFLLAPGVIEFCSAITTCASAGAWKKGMELVALMRGSADDFGHPCCNRHERSRTEDRTRAMIIETISTPLSWILIAPAQPAQNTIPHETANW